MCADIIFLVQLTILHAKMQVLYTQLPLCMHRCTVFVGAIMTKMCSVIFTFSRLPMKSHGHGLLNAHLLHPYFGQVPPEAHCAYSKKIRMSEQSHIFLYLPVNTMRCSKVSDNSTTVYLSQGDKHQERTCNSAGEEPFSIFLSS